MTHIPPITREARDYLLKTANEAGMQSNDYLVATIIDMPLAPADPLDAVRARFQPKTRGGYEYEIFAERDGELYGRVFYTGKRAFSYPCSWESPQGKTANAEGENTYDLLPVSPHAALIAELRNVSGVYSSITADLLKRAADALEKQP